MARFGHFDIEQSVAVAAPQQRVFDLIANLRAWELWNPNGMNDPSVERSYGGSPGRKGSTLRWRGRRSGRGQMEIIEVSQPDLVTVGVSFEAPFKVFNVNTFKLSYKDGATSVNWSMHGPMPLVAKVISLVVRPEKMMRGHFEAGLRHLKAIAEEGSLQWPSRP